MKSNMSDLISRSAAIEAVTGWDATNPKWIESGRAVPCEYGIYPLTRDETEEVEVI